MSSVSPTLPEPDFAKRLKPFHRRESRFWTGSILLLLLALICIAIVAAMWLDIIWALPASARWFITRPAILLALVAAIALIVWQRWQRADQTMAQRIDTSHQTGGEIIAGWQLATRPAHPDSMLSQSFAQLAATRAGQRVAGLSPATVITGERVKQAGILLAVVVSCIALLAVVIPQIVGHQLNRFLYPALDFPPYTGVFIELELQPPSVLYGQDVIAVANVKGGTLEKMTLVSRNVDGSESTLPMLSHREDRFQAILTRVTEPLEIYAHSGKSRSKILRLDVQMTPKILPPQVIITPPAYTRGGTYRGVLPEQGLIGLVGTQVEWAVGSNRPLQAGMLDIVFSDGTTELIELKRSDKINVTNDSVFASMALTKPGQFTLSVTDVDGLQSHEKVQGSIKILSDVRPVVRIVEPKQMSIATPDINLPVVVLAEDDFGITKLSLYRSLNGSPAMAIEAKVDGGARQEAKWSLPLAKYRVVPGDEIQLFARTEDNDPAGAKGAESPVTTITIIAIEEFQKLMLQKEGMKSVQAKYQQARRYLENLAQALRDVEEAEKTLAANPDSAEAAQKLQEAIAAAEKSAQGAAKAIDELSKQAMPIDIDQELAKGLQGMSKMAAEMGKNLASMKKDPVASSDSSSKAPGLSQEQKEQLAEMLKKLGSEQKKLNDDAIQPLENMQKIMPLVIDQQRFAQIAVQQRDLANRLNSLHQQSEASEDSQRRIADLEAEQEQLRQSLDTLLDDIEAHANDLPTDDPELDALRDTAQRFVDGVRSSDAEMEMTSTQQGLLRADFASAQRDAVKAAEILESFLSECSGMGQSACENCKAQFKPSAGSSGFGNSIRQMLDMMGMKPGSSMNPGGKPGMGMGWGAGGGFSQRFPGPENIGMYGAMPTPPQQQPKSGRGEKSSGSIATNQTAQTTGGGDTGSENVTQGNASGQSLDSIPGQYRGQVADYYRRITEQLGQLESNEGNP